jgi:ankyrin repeat protein
MNKRFRPFVFLLALSLLTQSCGLFVSSNHRTKDYTVLFANTSAGNLEAVKAAVSEDRSVLAAREWDNATLLHLAVGQNQKEMTEYLLDEGADVNAVTTDGLTPLHMAAQNGNIPIAQILLDHKAKINAVDAKGWTPLDRANKWGHADAAEFLRQHGGREGGATH